MTRKIISIILCLLLFLQQLAWAQPAASFSPFLSSGTLAPGYALRLPHLRCLEYNLVEENFKAIIDKGSQPDSFAGKEAPELFKYFLTGVSLPSEKFWVNLRPDSPDKIIDPLLGRTDLGKVLLEADLMLKKDTARLVNPSSAEGRQYWSELRAKAKQLFGSEDTPIPAMARPWIVPGEIIIRETATNAYVYKATLNVLLEGDYLQNPARQSSIDGRALELNEYSAQLLKRLIIPRLNLLVNNSVAYAPLRQAYYSLILAQWFKTRFKDGQGKYSSLINSEDISGVTSLKEWSAQDYFKKYRNSFSRGEFSFTDTINTTEGTVSRVYVSGGMNLAVNIPAQPPIAGSAFTGPVLCIRGADDGSLPFNSSMAVTQLDQSILESPVAVAAGDGGESWWQKGREFFKGLGGKLTPQTGEVGSAPSAQETQIPPAPKLSVAEIKARLQASEYRDQSIGFHGVDLEHFVYAQYALLEGKLPDKVLQGLRELLGISKELKKEETYKFIFNKLAAAGYGAAILDFINQNTYSDPRLEIEIINQSGKARSQGVNEAVANGLDALGLEIGHKSKGVKQILSWLGSEGSDSIDVYSRMPEGTAQQLTVLKAANGQEYIQARQLSREDFQERYARISGAHSEQGTILAVRFKKKLPIRKSDKKQGDRISQQEVSESLIDGFSCIKGIDVLVRTDADKDWVKANAEENKRTVLAAEQETPVNRGRVQVIVSANAIYIVDNGTGMDAEVIARVFVPKEGTKGKRSRVIPVILKEELKRTELITLKGVAPQLIFLREGRKALALAIPEDVNPLAVSSEGLAVNLARLVDVSESWDSIVVPLDLKPGEKTGFEQGIENIIERLMANQSLDAASRLRYLNTLVTGLEGLEKKEPGYEHVVSSLLIKSRAAAAPLLKKLKDKDVIVLPHEQQFSRLALPAGKQVIFLNPRLFAWDVSMIKQLGGKVLSGVTASGERKLPVLTVPFNENDLLAVREFQKKWHLLSPEQRAPVIRTDRFLAVPAQLAGDIPELIQKKREKNIGTEEEKKLEMLLTMLNVMSGEKVNTSYEMDEPYVNLQIQQLPAAEEGRVDTLIVQSFLAYPPLSDDADGRQMESGQGYNIQEQVEGIIKRMLPLPELKQPGVRAEYAKTFINLAALEYRLGNREKAEKYYQQAMQISNSLEVDALVEFMSESAVIMRNAGENKKSDEFFDAAMTLINGITDRRQKVSSAGFIALQQMQAGMEKEAAENFRIAEAWANNEPVIMLALASAELKAGLLIYPLTVAQFLSGKIAELSNEFLSQLAIVLAKEGRINEAVAISSRLGFTRERAEAEAEIGAAAARYGVSLDKDSGFDMYDSLSIFLAENDSDFEHTVACFIICKANVGIISDNSMYPTMISTNHKDKVEAFVAIARTQARKDNQEEAQRSLLKAVEVALNIRDVKEQSDSLLQILQAQIDLGLIEQAKQTLGQITDLENKSRGLLELSGSLLVPELNEKSRVLTDETIKQLEEANANPFESIEILELSGRKEEAISLFNRWDSNRKSLTAADKVRRLDFIYGSGYFDGKGIRELKADAQFNELDNSLKTTLFFRIALRQVETGNKEEAAKAFAEACSIAKGEGDTGRLLSFAYAARERLGLSGEVRPLLDQAEKLAVDLKRDKFYILEAKIKLGIDVLESVKEIEKFGLSMKKRNGELAVILAEAGMINQALFYLNSIENISDIDRGNAAVALAYLRQGRVPDSLVTLESIKNNAIKVNTLFSLAVDRHLAADKNLEDEFLDYAMRLSNNKTASDDYFLNIVAGYLKLGRFKEALAVIEGLDTYKRIEALRLIVAEAGKLTIAQPPVKAQTIDLQEKLQVVQQMAGQAKTTAEEVASLCALAVAQHALGKEQEAVGQLKTAMQQINKIDQESRGLEYYQLKVDIANTYGRIGRTADANDIFTSEWENVKRKRPGSWLDTIKLKAELIARLDPQYYTLNLNDIIGEVGLDITMHNAVTPGAGMEDFFRKQNKSESEGTTKVLIEKASKLLMFKTAENLMQEINSKDVYILAAYTICEEQIKAGKFEQALELIDKYFTDNAALRAELMQLKSIEQIKRGSFSNWSGDNPEQTAWSYLGDYKPDSKKALEWAKKISGMMLDKVVIYLEMAENRHKANDLAARDDFMSLAEGIKMDVITMNNVFSMLALKYAEFAEFDKALAQAEKISDRVKKIEAISEVIVKAAAAQGVETITISREKKATTIQLPSLQELFALMDKKTEESGIPVDERNKAVTLAYKGVLMAKTGNDEKARQLFAEAVKEANRIEENGSELPGDKEDTFIEILDNARETGLFNYTRDVIFNVAAAAHMEHLQLNIEKYLALSALEKGEFSAAEKLMLDWKKYPGVVADMRKSVLEKKIMSVTTDQEAQDIVEKAIELESEQEMSQDSEMFHPELGHIPIELIKITYRDKFLVMLTGKLIALGEEEKAKQTILRINEVDEKINAYAKFSLSPEMRNYAISKIVELQGQEPHSVYQSIGFKVIGCLQADNGNYADAWKSFELIEFGAVEEQIGLFLHIVEQLYKAGEIAELSEFLNKFSSFMIEEVEGTDEDPSEEMLVALAKAQTKYGFESQGRESFLKVWQLAAKNDFIDIDGTFSLAREMIEAGVYRTAQLGSLDQVKAEKIMKLWNEEVIPQRAGLISGVQGAYDPLLELVPEGIRPFLEDKIKPLLQELYSRQEKEALRQFGLTIDSAESLDLSKGQFEHFNKNAALIIGRLRAYIEDKSAYIIHQPFNIQQDFYASLFSGIFRLCLECDLQAKDIEQEGFFEAIALGWHPGSGIELQATASVREFIRALEQANNSDLNIESLVKLVSFMSNFSALEPARNVDILLGQINKIMRLKSDARRGYLKLISKAFSQVSIDQIAGYLSGRNLNSLTPSAQELSFNRSVFGESSHGSSVMSVPDSPSPSMQHNIGVLNEALSFMVFLTNNVEDVGEREFNEPAGKEIQLPAGGISISQIMQLEQNRLKSGAEDDWMDMDYLIENINYLPAASDALDADIINSITNREPGSYATEITQNYKDPVRSKGIKGELQVEFFIRKNARGEKEYLEMSTDNGPGVDEGKEVALILPKSTKVAGRQQGFIGFFGTGKYPIAQGVDRLQIITKNDKRAYLLEFTVQKDAAGNITGFPLTRIKVITDNSLKRGHSYLRIKDLDSTIPALDQMFSKRIWKTNAGMAAEEDARIYFLNSQGEKQELTVDKKVGGISRFIAPAEDTDQQRVVEKSRFSEFHSIRGTVLDPNNKDGIWEEASLTEVRLKPNTYLEKEAVQKIAQGDFAEVWAILQEFQPRDFGELRVYFTKDMPVQIINREGLRIGELPETYISLIPEYLRPLVVKLGMVVQIPSLPLINNRTGIASEDHYQQYLEKYIALAFYKALAHKVLTEQSPQFTFEGLPRDWEVNNEYWKAFQLTERQEEFGVNSPLIQAAEDVNTNREFKLDYEFLDNLSADISDPLSVERMLKFIVLLRVPLDYNAPEDRESLFERRQEVIKRVAPLLAEIEREIVSTQGLSVHSENRGNDQFFHERVNSLRGRMARLEQYRHLMDFYVAPEDFSIAEKELVAMVYSIGRQLGIERVMLLNEAYVGIGCFSIVEGKRTMILNRRLAISGMEKITDVVLHELAHLLEEYVREEPEKVWQAIDAAAGLIFTHQSEGLFAEGEKYVASLALSGFSAFPLSAAAGTDGGRGLPVVIEAKAVSVPTGATPVMANGDLRDGGKGGIDFSSLPAFIPQAPPLNARQNIPVNWESLFVQEYPEELRILETSVKEDKVPQIELIRQALKACCSKGRVSANKTAILGCLAEIIRLQEEQAVKTGQELRQLLVLLDSGKSDKELTALLN